MCDDAYVTIYEFTIIKFIITDYIQGLRLTQKFRVDLKLYFHYYIYR